MMLTLVSTVLSGSLLTLSLSAHPCLRWFLPLAPSSPPPHSSLIRHITDATSHHWIASDICRRQEGSFRASRQVTRSSQAAGTTTASGAVKDMKGAPGQCCAALASVADAATQHAYNSHTTGWSSAAMNSGRSRSTVHTKRRAPEQDQGGTSPESPIRPHLTPSPRKRQNGRASGLSHSRGGHSPLKIYPGNVFANERLSASTPDGDGIFICEVSRPRAPCTTALRIQTKSSNTPACTAGVPPANEDSSTLHGGKLRTVMPWRDEDVAAYRSKTGEEPGPFHFPSSRHCVRYLP
ncbi:hypothetical protein V8E36_005074 [Tilletia maclaganii]